MVKLYGVTFPPLRASIPAARTGVLGCLRARGLDRVADKAALLTSELVTNAVIHARTPVHVGVGWDGPRVQVHVADRSHKTPQPRPLRRAEPDGRGLMLVAAMAQRWGVEPLTGGKVVWFELNPPTLSVRRGSMRGMVRRLASCEGTMWGVTAANSAAPPCQQPTREPLRPSGCQRFPD